MRILFVSPSSPPVPYGTGLQVHNWGNIQALQLLGHEVFLVMLSKYGEDKETIIIEASDANKELRLCTTIEIPKQNKRSLNSLSLLLILKELTESLIKKESYIVPNYHSVCSDLEQIILDTKAEIVWYEDFYVAVFDRWINRKIPAIYNSHDNQARLYKQKNLSGNHSNKRIGSKIRKIIYQNWHRTLEKSEFRIQRRCDIMLTGNSEDAALSKLHNVNAITRKVPVVGANNELLDKRKNWINIGLIQKKKVKLIHLGALHGSFTSKSLLWFLCDIWKDILRKFKDIDIELHIIGSGSPSEELLKQIDQKNIIYRGFVENLMEEFIDTFAMVIPGQISTGIRIRLPVSFSMMVPVIGNELSFHGMLDAKDGETVLYAENEDEYSSAIEKLMDNTSYYKSMCQNGRSVYDDNFSIKAASVDIQRSLSNLNLFRNVTSHD